MLTWLLQLYFCRLFIKFQFRAWFHTPVPLATDTEEEFLLTDFVYARAFTSLLKNAVVQTAEIALRGEITPGRVETSLWGRKGDFFELVWEGIAAARRDHTVPWRDARAPGMGGSAFFTAMQRASPKRR